MANHDEATDNAVGERPPTSGADHGTKSTSTAVIDSSQDVPILQTASAAQRAYIARATPHLLSSNASPSPPPPPPPPPTAPPYESASVFPSSPLHSIASPHSPSASRDAALESPSPSAYASEPDGVAPMDLADAEQRVGHGVGGKSSPTTPGSTGAIGSPTHGSDAHDPVTTAAGESVTATTAMEGAIPPPLVPTPPPTATSSGVTTSRAADVRGAASASPAPSTSGSAAHHPRARSSRHTVPRGFRGPVPLVGDAEDVAPRPSLVVAAGSTSMFQTVHFPINRNGWRYTAAGPATDELPLSVYRSLEFEPSGVHWSWTDRSAFTKLSADASVVGSDKGFRSARANVPVREGAWYVEMHVLPPELLVGGGVGGGGGIGIGTATAVGAGGGVGASGGAPTSLPSPMRDGPHVRVGWGRREAGLNAPVGFDGYSYGLRDRTGEKVWLARPSSYGVPFGPGDVVGLYIRLPEARRPRDSDPWDPARRRRKRLPIRYRGQLYFESLEYAPTKEMEALMEASRRGTKLTGAGLAADSAGAMGSGAADGVQAQANQGARDGIDTASAASGGATASSTTTKKRRGLKGDDAATGKAASLSTAAGASAGSSAPLRPLPTLGADASKIGFFVNGEPQGVAFRDLYDFRPLRRADAAPTKSATTTPTGKKGRSERTGKEAPSRAKPGGRGAAAEPGRGVTSKRAAGGGSRGAKGAAKTKAAVAAAAAASGSLGLSAANTAAAAVEEDEESGADAYVGEEDDDEEAVAITSSSSVAHILKSRQNAFDDGALGYYPFVSCYGGARVRIVARREEFRYPPPDDVEAALEACDRRKYGRGDEGQNGEGAAAAAMVATTTTAAKREHESDPNSAVASKPQPPVPPLPPPPPPPPRPRWRPLSERFDEFLEEMWRLDLEDERRAEARAARRRERGEDDDEEGQGEEEGGDDHDHVDEGGRLDDDARGGDEALWAGANGLSMDARVADSSLATGARGAAVGRARRPTSAGSGASAASRAKKAKTSTTTTRTTATGGGRGSSRVGGTATPRSSSSTPTARGSATPSRVVVVVVGGGGGGGGGDVGATTTPPTDPASSITRLGQTTALEHEATTTEVQDAERNVLEPVTGEGMKPDVDSPTADMDVDGETAGGPSLAAMDTSALGGTAARVKTEGEEERPHEGAPGQEGEKSDPSADATMRGVEANGAGEAEARG